MFRRAFLTCAAVAIASPLWSADDADAVAIQVSAAQIRDMLAGNTIVGSWSGSTYRQYYYENGRTIYQPDGGRPDEGKWRVNADTNQYDSWWEQTGWTPYTIMMTNDGFAWVNGDKLEPFTVLKGKQGDF